MYDVFLLFFDADVVGVVVRGGDAVKSIDDDDDVGGGPDDDDDEETGKKGALGLVLWTVDLNMSPLLRGIGKEVVYCGMWEVSALLLRYL
jgi:hypothetical protein